ncbi:hypothetical protein AMECASPLE_038949 [Ameca splendens]|uniref:Uncharacterized protein n=1 Tax=Ameca splendens TaxID=208324 RepID=A0ABV0ZT41_9TELE
MSQSPHPNKKAQTQSSSPPSIMTCGTFHTQMSMCDLHFFYLHIPLVDIFNPAMKKCLIQIFGFLILDLGMTVSPVHHGDGLLESQPERNTMWFLYNQGFSVLIQSVEGLFNQFHLRQQL